MKAERIVSTASSGFPSTCRLLCKIEKAEKIGQSDGGPASYSLLRGTEDASHQKREHHLRSGVVVDAAESRTTPQASSQLRSRETELNHNDCRPWTCEVAADVLGSEICSLW